MSRLFALAALVFLISFDVVSQDSIAWNSERPLKWADFRGRADSLSRESAACAASIYVKGVRDESGLPDFKVYNSFIKNDAWTRDTTSVTVLQHEQLHFDIAEVYARKIRRVVDSLRQKKIKSAASYSLEITKLLAAFETTGKLYDQETAHGTYGDRQLEWNQKIWKELHALNHYMK